MSVRDVAEGLVELCRRGDLMGAVDRFYDEDIVSIEPVGSPELPAEIRGLDAVRRKNEWWGANNDVHSFDVEGPYVGEDGFAVGYTMDFTSKATGQRMQVTEVALYKVKDDRIVEERFFYNAPGQ